MQHLPRLLMSRHPLTQNIMPVSHRLDLLIIRSFCKKTFRHAQFKTNYRIIADLKVPLIPAMSKRSVFYGAIDNVNIATLMTDILKSDISTHPKEHVSELWYLEICTTLLDKHVPVKYK